jgi:hypothetical protein
LPRAGVERIFPAAAVMERAGFDPSVPLAEREAGEVGGIDFIAKIREALGQNEQRSKGLLQP